VLFAVAAFLPFMIDAWSFVIAALLLLSIRSLRQAVQRPVVPAGSHPRLRDDIREGWQFLWGHEILRPLAGAFALVSIAFQMPLAVLVLFVHETLGLGARGYAVILTVITVGPVLGGMFGDRLVRRIGRSTSLTVALTTWGICLLATALYPHAWFVALAATMQAIATAVWNMTTVSLRQVLVPNELFGRVNSIYRWFGWGMIPVGALLGAAIASWLGLRAPYVAAAAVIVVAWLIVRRLDRVKVDEATASMIRPAS
jgi:Na+/melibiose symporter-like transporter